MNSSAARYADWKAPAADGEILLWPDAGQILTDATENSRRLAAAESVRIQNIPLPELRARMRRWIGSDASDKLVFATGHQAELHHPGVWVKNIVIDAAASRAGGAGFHIAVDTDEPKHLQLRWPGGAEPLTDDPNASSAAWAGLVSPPSPAHLQRIAQELQSAAAAWNFQPVAPDFLDAMKRLSLENATLPQSLTNALHELDWSLGLRHHALILSPLCGCEAYLAFVHHVLARAGEFAADYNAALDEYRAENKIRTIGRPMPNLRVSDDSCEVPFWCDDLSNSQRQRATVVRDGSDWAIRHNGDRFVFDPNLEGWTAASRLAQWLRRHGLRLSPRALTLTTVLRLFVTDQFVHGIGGARYDQVTDKLIARHFKLDPPRFCVATATLFFPAAAGQERVCVQCVLQEGHRMKHSAIGSEKTRYLEAIASAPRRSTERSALFSEMHGKLTDALEASGALRTWQTRVEEARRRDVEEQDLFNRELFYAIQSRDRLEGLIERYRAAFGLDSAVSST